MEDGGLKVAKVCEKLGVTRNQLLHWEKKDLLGVVERVPNPDSGMDDRVYSKSQLKRIGFIKTLGEHGVENTSTAKYLIEYLETGHIALVDEIRAKLQENK